MYKHNHIQKRIVHSYIRTIFKFIAYTTLSLLPQSRLRNPLVPFDALKGVTCYACKGTLYTYRYVSLPLLRVQLYQKITVTGRGIEPLYNLKNTIMKNTKKTFPVMYHPTREAV